MSTDAMNRQPHALALLLRQKRCSLGYSIEAVAREIGASARVIQALEEDGGQSLGGIYARTYVHRYVTWLKLDVDVAEVCSLDQPSWVMPPGPQKKHLALLRRLPIRRLAGVTVAALGVGWILLSWPFDFEKWPMVTEPNRAHGGVEVRQIEPRQLMRYGDLTIDGADSRALNALSVSQRLETVDSVQPSGAIRHVLSVQFIGDSWFELRDATGKRLEHDLMRADSVRQYEGEPPFDMLVGLADAVQLSLNGELIDHSGWADGLQSSAGRHGLTMLTLQADGTVSRAP